MIVEITKSLIIPVFKQGDQFLFRICRNGAQKCVLPKAMLNITKKEWNDPLFYKRNLNIVGFLGPY